MPSQPKALTITGWVLTALLSLLLTFSATMKFLKPKELVEEFTRLGYPERLALTIGIIEIGCVILFLIPRTAVLGAILLTGYLGGATATHVRIGDPFFSPIIVGMVVWLALILRHARIRAMLPIVVSAPRRG